MKLIAALGVSVSVALLGCSGRECDSCGGNIDDSSLLKCPDTQTVDMGDVVMNEGMKSKTLDIPGVKLHNISCKCVTVVPSETKVEIQYRAIKGMGPDQQFARLMKQDGTCLGLVKVKARRVPACEVIPEESGKSWRLVVHTSKANGAPILAENQAAAKIKPIGERTWLLTTDQKTNVGVSATLEGSQIKVSIR